MTMIAKVHGAILVAFGAQFSTPECAVAQLWSRTGRGLRDPERSLDHVV
jgi:hypothetical protein